MSVSDAITAAREKISRSAELRAETAIGLAAFALRRQDVETRAKEMGSRLAALEQAVLSVRGALSGDLTQPLQIAEFAAMDEVVDRLANAILPGETLARIQDLAAWPERAGEQAEQAENILEARIDDVSDMIEAERTNIAGHASAILEAGNDYVAAIGEASDTACALIEDMKDEVLAGLESWRELSAGSAAAIIDTCKEQLRTALGEALGETAGSALEQIERVQGLTERTFGHVKSTLDQVNGKIGGVAEIVEPIKPALDLIAAI